MAASNMYPVSGDTAAVQTVNLIQQQKVLQDVLETIIHLKVGFFEGHQPITDDSIDLQRFCAKFEHLLQMALKGELEFHSEYMNPGRKTSLLGRKKDYWDYFCDCLGSSRGSNEGIKYVKSLSENKTSLGRGRAFIRFCLVHQRLADAIQQCQVNDKTGMWFLPGSIFLHGHDFSPLINALYDLNSLHFDLAPRGYDLDSSWPSFANRKVSAGGGWTVPISRRSSITSMDTLSQISVSMIDQSEVDKLTKDLEDVQSVKNDLIGQLGALEHEKKEACQSAWTSQGELQAVQEQLAQLQSKHSELQERFHNLDLDYVHLKMERDHIERLRQEEIKNVKEGEAKRVQQLKQEERIWKTEMKQESERRNKEIQKLQLELDKKTSQEEARSGEIVEHWSSLKSLLEKLNIEEIPGDFMATVLCIETHLASLRESLNSSNEKNKQTKEYEDQILSLKCQLEDQDNRLADAEKYTGDSTLKMSSLEKDLSRENDNNRQLQSQLTDLTENLKKQEDECIRATEKLKEAITTRDKLEGDIAEARNQNKDLLIQLKEKEKDLQELNQTMKENLPVFAQNLEDNKTELARSNQQLLEENTEISDCQERIKALEADAIGHVERIAEKDSQIQKLRENFETSNKEKSLMLHEKNDDISKLRQELAETESKLSTLIQDFKETEKEKMSFSDKLSSTIASLESMKGQFEGAQAKLIESEENVVKINEDLKETVKAKEVVESEKNELETKSKSMLDEMGSLMQAVEEYKASAKSKEEEREAVQSELLSSKAELETTNRELRAEKNQRILLLQDSDGIKKSEGQKSQQMTALFEQVEGLKEENGNLEGQVRELLKDLAHETENKISLGCELDPLKTHLQKEMSEKAHLETEHKSQMESLVSKHEDVMKKLHEGALRTLQSYKNQSDNVEAPEFNDAKSADIDGDGKERLFRIEEVFEKLNHLCLLKREEEQLCKEDLSSLSDQVNALTMDRDLLLTQTDAALDDAQQIKSQLTQTSEQLTIAYSNIEIINNENSSLHSKLSHLNELVSRMEKDKGDLSSEVSSLKEACRIAEDEVQTKLSEKRDVEVELEDVRTQLKSVLDEKSVLDGIVGNLQSQTDFSTKVLEESLTDSKNALEAALVEKMDLEGKIVTLVTELEKVNVTVKDIKVENEKYQGELESMKYLVQSDSDRSTEMDSLKQKLVEEREEHSSTVEVLNQQISALEFELSAEQMANENKNQTSANDEDMEAQINVLESLVENLKEEKFLLEKRLKEDEGLKASKVSELQKQVHSQERETSRLSQQLAEVEEQLTSVTEVKDKVYLDLVQLKFSINTKVQENETELQTLRSDNAQLKKKLVKLVKDKDELWHKTDQLVDERKRKASERWQENSQVTKCSQCKAEFSLFLRKHHCRKCGKIYCYSCSDFWLDTPHSSKKSRVCQGCFDQHNNGAESANSSMLLNERESDEDEEEREKEGGSQNVSVRSSDGASLGRGSNFSRETSVSRKEESPENNGSIHSGESSLPFDSAEGAHAAFGNDNITSGNAPENTATEPAANKLTENIDKDDAVEKSLGDSEDSLYQMVTEEEIQTSITEYESPSQLSNIPDNMSSSMLLSADDLDSGRVNRQSEVWIKPGKMFAIPIKVSEKGATLSWEFSSQPKDIVFSIYFRVDTETTDGEEIVAPCKCNAHKQIFKGELTAKQCGVYTLIFDNTYSRLTSKKVHYQLEYQKNVVA